MIDCSEQEKQNRLDVCKNCEKFKIEENFTTSCSQCACPIAFMISFIDNKCPLDKWVSDVSNK